MNSIRKNFKHGVETLADTHKESAILVQTAKEETNGWTTTRTMLDVGMIPLLREWLARLQTARKPFSLRLLYLHRHWLRRYIGVTWWQPQALRFRLQISRLWLLVQYERLRAWLLRLYHRLLQWCIRNRTVLISIALAIVLVVAFYYWLQFTDLLWRNMRNGVRTFWEYLFGS